MEDKTFKEKLVILKKLFILFDRLSEELKKACLEGCSACCTRNVTLTGLEAKYVLDGLNSDEKEAILTKIVNESHKKRLVPQTTINELAKLCMAGEEPPEEFGDPAWGECPLLSDNRCMIYALRPFACRCMISKQRCDVTGFSEMDEYAVTLSNVFMQYLEHIDIGGHFGNLSDMLLIEGGNKSHVATIQPDNILVNKSLEMLMVPLEDREMIAHVIKEIQKTMILT
ncbi:MAG: YkgJ family cysteine cluster protein [Desulfamplus sp.]|nr:YkgJ family cysteine cluster protein [Desulfamplus sp.]